MDKTLYYRSKSFRNGKYWLLTILTICILTSSKEDKPEVRVLFVGDILLSRNVKTELQTRKANPWESLKSLFHSADWVVGNLEGAVGTILNQQNPAFGSPTFYIDAKDISLLKEAGFQTITLENNHSLDLGTIRKMNTIEALKQNDITPVYLDNSPRFFTIKDVVFSLVTLNIIMSRDSTKNQIPSIEIEQKLRLARNLSNIVIVSIHWGSELLDWPNREQRETAAWLIKNGADIIIGSHPHVVQKPELIDGKPVFFSLGNHLFDQKYPRTKQGLIVDIRVQDGKFSCNGFLTHTQRNSFYPELSDTVNFQFAPIAYRNTPLQINKFTLKPVSVTDGNENKIVLQAYENDKLLWITHPMTIISINTCKLDGENEYLFALEKHYSSLDGEMNVRPYVYSLDNKGLFARWRGSALAWPLIDAQISPHNSKVLCALHRADSFINPDQMTTKTRSAAYEWNGFGFKGLQDSINCEDCKKLYK